MKPSAGMVVSAHPLASRAGASVLKEGGNAVDAAVSTSLVLGVVEPAFSGIGGGGFALLRTADGESVALDYRETAPAASSPDMFSDGSQENRIGPLAIATPGLVAGQAVLLEEYGTMSFSELAARAAELAKSVVRLPTLSHQMLQDRRSSAFKKIKRFQASSEVFIGQKSFPLLAQTLGRLRTKGPQEFYRGLVPETVSRFVRNLGGIISEEDFGRYSPKKRRPVSVEYMGLELLSMPPPSAGGTLLMYGLQLAEELAAELGPTQLSNAAILQSMLAEKPLFGDPDFSELRLDSLKSKKAVRRTAEAIRKVRLSSPRRPMSQDVGSTSHFSVVDKEGNVMAVTETIECYYGSGVTIPGLGLIMNDEMHDFDVTPGQPNSVEPMKRPASSMTPTIVLKDGSPYLALGGAGSERIISSVFQTLRNVVEGGMDLQRALAAPRVHVSGGAVEVEGGNTQKTMSALRKAGLKTHRRPPRDAYFGGVQAIMVDPISGKVSGAADPRRMGAQALA